MKERQVLERLPSANGIAAAFTSGCPSAGGQQTIGLSHLALSQSPALASESRMAQRSVQRLERGQRMLPCSLVEAFIFASHRRPNPSVKRTVNGGPRLVVFGVAVPPLSAAYLQR
jgi:hypothetical protein